MADRKLPSRNNPLLREIEDEEYRQEIVAKRKLGQTELSVEVGQIGTSNATRPQNLGLFDYAHVRVPLPKDLKGSGIFHASRGHSTPSHYFLMRRSSDGFVSGSGMFKVTFPWASEAEEHAEKAHLKTISGVDKEEIAGNIWIPPQQALELADEYNIRAWIGVLLDPGPIPGSNADGSKKIKAPPVFHASTTRASPARSTRARTPTAVNGTSIPAPEESPQNKSPRKRALRSVSPVKRPAAESDTASKARKIATPKRSRKGRGTTASVEPEEQPAAAATAPKRKVSKALTTPTEETGEDTIKVDITSSVEVIPPGDEEVETTKVVVETPAKHPQVELPSDAQAYLDSAKKAISEAKHLKADHAASVRGRKRKAADITRDEDGDEEQVDGVPQVEPTRAEAEDADELPAPKRARLNDIEVRKDKVKKRATIGIVAGLAFGAVAPVVFGAIFGA